MRDINRIPEILKALEKAWQTDPDLRLGQLIVNATRPRTPNREVFFIEDEDILEALVAIGNKDYASLQRTGRTPYWKLYPEILRIDLEELTPELLQSFLEVVRQEEANLVITPRSIMKLVAAPIDSPQWMETQNDRIEKIKHLLEEFERKGLIEAMQIGYQFKKG